MSNYAFILILAIGTLITVDNGEKKKKRVTKHTFVFGVSLYQQNAEWYRSINNIINNLQPGMSTSNIDR